MSKARDLSDFISDATVDASEIADLAVTHAKLHTDMNLSSKTLTFAADQISGNAVNGGVISNFASTGIDDNASSTAVTIASSGNVGIGDANPVTSLDVRSSINTSTDWWTNGKATIFAYNTNASGDGILKLIGATGTQRIVYGLGANADKLIFSSRQAESDTSKTVVIDNNGNVGIGTADPWGKMQVQINSSGGPGSGSSAGMWLRNGSGSSGQAFNMFWGNSLSAAAGSIALVVDDNANNYGSLEFQTRTPNSGYSTKLAISSDGSVLHKNNANDASEFIFNDGWSAEARNIRVWGEEEASGGIGRWASFLGTNVSKDGDGTYTKPSDDASSNWGNIAGMLFTGANTSGQNAIDFIVDLPSSHGGGLNASMTGSDLYNKSAMSITAGGNVGIGTTSPSVNLEVSDSGNSFILVKNTSSGSGLYIKADTGGGAELQTAGGNNTLVMRTSGHERMRITSDGVVSMPHQCNVSAFPSASAVTITQNSTWQILQFNSTRWDNNSDYNTSNSRFTAPVTGKYLFGINLQLEQANGIIWSYIVPLINGNAAGTSGNNMADFTPPNGTYFNHAATWMLTLSANDYVELQAIGSGGSYSLKGNTESSYYIALMA